MQRNGQKSEQESGLSVRKHVRFQSISLDWIWMELESLSLSFSFVTYTLLIKCTKHKENSQLASVHQEVSIANTFMRNYLSRNRLRCAHAHTRNKVSYIMTHTFATTVLS